MGLDARLNTASNMRDESSAHRAKRGNLRAMVPMHVEKGFGTGFEWV
jgi:hypothetical protein